MSNTSIILSLVFAACGLGMHFYNNQKNKQPLFITDMISWFFLALSVASIFTMPVIKGKLFGFEFEGQIAAFAFTWYVGYLISKRALKLQVYANQQATSKIIAETKHFDYSLKNVPNKKIGMITGNILNVKNIDVWVNSENTNMQMARFYDRSISGLIRYHAAIKDDNGYVKNDLVASELMQRVGNVDAVVPATVHYTSAGELTKSNGVKLIFHVAAVRGTVGEGYIPIPKLSTCVSNCLNKADRIVEQKINSLQSIIFPLFGTGSAGGNAEETVNQLIGEAINYLEKCPNSSIQNVYFLAFTENDLELCQKNFKKNDRVVK